jgi:DNA adenine methylase
MYSIKSPLRYPGGKSRALEQIEQHIPLSFDEFREPFVGGGTVFIWIRQKFPLAKVWINDLNFDLFCFWKEAKQNLHRLISEVKRVKENELDGKALFLKMREDRTQSLSDFDRAVRFFVMNRITFSGTVDSGGFSETAFHRRFTHTSIERLSRLKSILDGVRITHLDYKNVLNEEANNTFIFLDPPYLGATESRLYGKNGNLHLGFDHTEFAEQMQKCQHKWLITYDDSPTIRERFSFAHLREWELQYGMNNYKQDKAEKGKELFISNYALTS